MMHIFTPDVVKFFIDNATGIVLGFAGMMMMYRLCDKHLSAIAKRMEFLGDLIQTNEILNKTKNLSLEKMLYRIDEQINQLRNYN